MIMKYDPFLPVVANPATDPWSYQQNFVKNLRKRTYPDWHLRDFTLISTTHEDARRRCERAIRKAVPSLQ